jgi:hypothetical protein
VIGPVKDKKIVEGSVSSVKDISSVYPQNVSGKSGGIFDVCNGTLYFLNNSSGYKKYYPTPFESMPDSSITDVSDYPSLFTGRFGQNENPTYSRVSVSTDCIIITTYEVFPNKTDTLLDEIKVVKSICGDLHNNLSDIIIIFPNPTTGELTITNRSLDRGKLSEANYKLGIKSVEVFDIMGRKLDIPHFAWDDVVPNEAQRNEYPTPSRAQLSLLEFPRREGGGQSHSLTINISHLSTGIYFLRIYTDKGMITKKVVKL